MARRIAVGNGQRGVAYLALLLLIAVMGTVLGTVAVVWDTAAQREKERELLFIGDQYRRAIMAYYEVSPSDKKYPMRLDDLLADPRFLGERRYLRQLYTDPMTNKNEWGLLTAPNGGIMGVYSLAPGTPIKKSNFPERYRRFTQAAMYADWRFSYEPTIR